MLTGELNPLPPALFGLYLFALGLCVGSFLNVVIYRLPDPERSLIRPLRSHCPHCGDAIPGWLNIPVFSWLYLRGRCRNADCKVPISVRYPLVELMTAGLFLAVGRRYGWSLATVSGLVLVASLVAVTFIDIDHFIIPDEISLPGVVLGILVRPFAFDAPWYDGLLGAAIGYGVLWAIRGIGLLVTPLYKGEAVEPMGLGDLKLLAMLGAFLGPASILPILLVSSTVGSVIGLVHRWVTSDDEEEAEDATSNDATSNDDTTSNDEADQSSEDGSAPTTSAEAQQNGVEEEEDEDEDDIPEGAIQFGPFLAIGGLAHLLFGTEVARLIRDVSESIVSGLMTLSSMLFGA